ncbi:MAG: hypothetical protein PQ612_09000 [Rickettsiales bacterium]|nr:hypothetical protein [Pseudomonadota bacterium]MDG4544110.1 hypothetical protein [Rickettsiales bacterium]MDG4546291.1 hypothetical protein [Rickettsiales bacterium]MDG4548434.1 hypothetical protein [Rickettsiales bacterium]
MKVNKVLIISSIALLSSCASKPDYTWFKEGLEAQGREYTIDDSKCTAESYRSAGPLPMSGCGGGSVSNSSCLGIQAGLGARLRKVREKIYEGCMLEKGWMKQPLE